MTSSLAICSLKGGVGKTTIALNLSYAIARSGIKTLLVDTDPQGAIGLSLQGSLREQPGLSAVVRDGLSPRSAWTETRQPGFSILPMGQVHALDSDDLVERARSLFSLNQIIEAARERFDLVVFDTPAGLGGMTRLVLENSDSLVIPVQCEPLALRALPQILELLEALHSRGSQCNLCGIVANMSSFRDPVVLASLEEVWAIYESVIFETSIPRDPKLLEASRSGVPVGLLARRPPPVSIIFDKLAAELDERLSLTRTEENEQPIPLLD